MFVRGSTTKRDDEVADTARTANPDEIDLDDDDDDDDDSGMLMNSNKYLMNLLNPQTLNISLLFLFDCFY